jgi:hypothetical protein
MHANIVWDFLMPGKGLSPGAAAAFLVGGYWRAGDWISNIQTLFTWLITLQFVVVASHDLVDIPGWTHGSQVQSFVGRRKLWLITLVNAIFPGLAVALAIYFWNRPKPGLVADYWVIYCAVTLASAIAMWYVPYLLGTTEERKRDYERMYAGTRQVLPPRGDNPRPNLLHVCFHALFAVNFFLALVLRFGSA